MHNIDLILTLAAGFIAALALGYGTHRLGWSPIVGYLLAGILVGPNTPGFVADRHLAEQLAEVGVILLMFGVGMHFHLKDLLAVRGIAIAGAIAQSATATALGALAFHALGLSWTSGIVLGLALSVASTVVLIRVLTDNSQLQSPTGRIAVGWLIMEDIFTVFILVLLPVVFAPPSSTSMSLPVAFALATFKVGAFVSITLVAGARFVPWLLEKVAETHSRELFTLSVLSVALGIAVSATIVFGVSMALGAFLAGMVVGQSEFSARAGTEALPMRDAFAVMFFLSVGLLFDPKQAFDAPWLTLATLAIVMLAKPLAAVLIVAALGYSSQIGFGVALALAQVGEFSFLLATLGRQLGALDEVSMNALIAAAILSIMVNPILYRAAAPLEVFVKKHPLLWRLLNRGKGPEVVATHGRAELQRTPAHRAVVVGYGPIGQLVTRILKEHGIRPVIIERNLDTFRTLQSDGDAAVYGDATSTEVLTEAGIDSAITMILSSSGSAANREAVRIARSANPQIHIVARADFLRDTLLLKKAGADEVFTGEGEVALAVAGSILQELGSTPEQLDEARERIRLRLIRTYSGRTA